MKTTKNLLCLLFLFLCLGHTFLAGQEKPENEKKIKKLLELLQNKDPQIRLAAAEKLAQMEIQTLRAIPILIKGLQDDNWRVHDFCFFALAKSGKTAVPFLCEALHHKDKKIKCSAAGILGQIAGISRKEGDAIPAIPILIKIAEEDEDITHVKSSAIWALGRIGPNAQEAIPVLLNLFRDEKLRFYYAEPPFLSLWLPKVRMPAPSVLGKYIINALGDMNAIVVLTYLLRDPDENIVIWTLDTIGYPKNASAAPVLIDILQRRQNSRIKLEIIKKVIITLGYIGKETTVAVPYLIQILHDQDPSVREQAAWALGCIGPKAVVAVPYLLQALHDPVSSVREQVAFAFGGIGKEAAVAIPYLIKALPNESPQVQKAIRNSIGLIQGEQEK
jgi:HEAT repeat protein